MEKGRQLAIAAGVAVGLGRGTSLEDSWGGVARVGL